MVPVASDGSTTALAAVAEQQTWCRWQMCSLLEIVTLSIVISNSKIVNGVACYWL